MGDFSHLVLHWVSLFFLFLSSLKKKIRSPRGRIFGMATDIEWLGVQYFFYKGKYVEDNLGLLFERQKNHTFFFFYAPPPLFLPWIIKRKLGYFDFEQRIWTIEHFEIKLGLKQAGTANCWKPQSWFPWFQEGERKTWLKVTDPATWRILREWLMCHVFWTGTFGSAISSDFCLGCTVILRERSLRLLLS